MERKAFDILRDGESSWWYLGRADVVRRVLKRFFSPTQGNKEILDFGAGHGGMKKYLEDLGEVDAFEPDEIPQTALSRQAYRTLYRDVHGIAGKKHYDLIAAFDVVEHVQEDDQLICGFRNILKEKGMLLITVPAHQWLWSTHDTMHHHHRRYSKKGLRALLEREGFTVQYIGYWNSMLFFPAVFLRFIGKGGEGSMKKGMINTLLSQVVSLENRFIPRFTLPIGLSLVVVATKS